MKLADKCEKLNLVGVYEMPDGTWVVTDGRRADANEFPCASKGAVLAKIAKFLEAMQPAQELSNNNTEVEMTALVTVQVSLCDPDTVMVNEQGEKFDFEAVKVSVEEAIAHAVNYGEQSGFIHNLAAEIAIGVAGTELLCVN